MRKHLLFVGAMVGGMLISAQAYARHECNGHLVPGDAKCGSIEYISFKHPHTVCSNSYEWLRHDQSYVQCHWVSGACLDYSKIGRNPDHCFLPGSNDNMLIHADTAAADAIESADFEEPEYPLPNESDPE